MKIYIAVKYVDNYRGTEFPPSPLKLIQAIIAATQDKYMDVLNALETQNPTIYSAEVTSQLNYEHYVINNDTRKERENSLGKKPKEEREISMKFVTDTDHFNAGVKKKEVARSFAEAAVHVAYEYEVPAELMPRLSEAVLKIHTLGRAGDWVFTFAQDTLSAGKFDVYRPADDGTILLRAPMQGSVASLFDCSHTMRLPMCHLSGGTWRIQ